MRGKSLILLALFLSISAWALAPRIFAIREVAAIEPSVAPATAAQEIPLSPMPTPSLIDEVQADWLTYTSPYWGISFRYPSNWAIRGAEENVSLGNATNQAERIKWTVGSPIQLFPTTSSPRAIYIFLQPYTISERISLADWVTERYKLDGMIGMPGPQIRLFSMPAKYVPEGFDQGIFSISDEPYNPAHILWLKRNDTVYMVWSIYNRPEDLALLFAIVSTVNFDPSIEQKMLDAAPFQGDEEAIRAQIVAMQPRPEPTATPGCDDICKAQESNAKIFATFEAAANLPARERPAVAAVPALAVDDDWITYSQPLMGISFRYPSNWTVDDPFASYQLDETGLLRTSIILYPNGEQSERGFVITLSPYTIGKEIPLHNWEAIKDQRERAPGSGHTLPYRQAIPINPDDIPAGADDMVQIATQVADSRGDNIWISVDGLVYWVLVYNSEEMLPVTLAALSTLQFNRAQLAKIHELTPFYGDEQTMAADMLAQWTKPTPTPIPTIDPLATATATPTSTPLVFATVTPSAFESPLVNGLKRYVGQSNFVEGSRYRLLYDPMLWQLSAVKGGENYLVHQAIKGCEITFYAPYETRPLVPVDLAGHEWAINDCTRDEQRGGLCYYGGWDDSSFGFTLTLPEPLPAEFDGYEKSQCELDAEAVLDTLTLVEKSTPVAATTTRPDAAILPTVTATPD